MSGEGILWPVEICEERLERLEGLQSQLDCSAALTEGGEREGEGEGGWEGEREEERGREEVKEMVPERQHTLPSYSPPSLLPPPSLLT